MDRLPATSPRSILYACHGQTIKWEGLQGVTINVVRSKLQAYASVNSTSTHPPPPPQPRGICSGSVPGVGHLCIPWRPPWNMIHMVSKTSTAQAVKLRVLFLCDGGFREKRVTVACLQRTRQAC